MRVSDWGWRAMLRGGYPVLYRRRFLPTERGRVPDDNNVLAIGLNRAVALFDTRRSRAGRDLSGAGTRRGSFAQSAARLPPRTRFPRTAAPLLKRKFLHGALVLIPTPNDQPSRAALKLYGPRSQHRLVRCST